MALARQRGPLLCLARVATLATALIAGGASADSDQGKFIDIYPKDAEEVQLILATLEASIGTDRTDVPPIMMMLHGPTAEAFVRKNYDANKALIDQTAKLVGYDVIEVKMCETWLEANDYDNSDLYPFVNTVPFGRAELQRLTKEENYSEYTVDL